MQLSITKLTTMMIVLLIAVTLVTTAAGIYVIQSNYRTLETRHEAEAQDTAHNAAIAIRNQIRFYQGILQLLTANPRVIDLIEFPDNRAIGTWSRTLSRLLPGTLGTALADSEGVVFGDPLSLRVGPACQADMQLFSSGGQLDYPLLHTSVPGLEHFDLLAKLHSVDGGPAGTLFVSFRLNGLRDLLEGMIPEGDQLELLNHDGVTSLTVGTLAEAKQVGVYRTDVPETSWSLVLHRARPATESILWKLFATDVLTLSVFGLLIISLLRATMDRFKIDLRRIHDGMTQVLDGSYTPSSEPTAIKETRALLPEIEQVALKLQRQRDELRHQSLSDPLTGVFNRRYFDLMLAHLHEQSMRQRPAVLIILDLNDFKHVNDQFGHSTGDQVLRNVALFLREHVRATDIVARLGGDEFALILTNIDERALNDWLSNLVGEYDGHPVLDTDKGAVQVSFSIGAAVIDARHYPADTHAFAAADHAMYAMKNEREAGRSQFAIAQNDEATPISSGGDRS